MTPGLPNLPLPLALALAAFQTETQPFRKIHRLVDTVEVLLKLHTVVLVSQWVAEQRVTPRLRDLLARGLATPSLGTWWEFARETARALQTEGAAPFVPGLYAFVLSGRLASEMNGQNNFLALRNAYSHGATPPDSVCAQDVTDMTPRLLALVEDISTFSWPSLVAVQLDGSGLEADGLGIGQCAPPLGAKPGQCFLLRNDGAMLPLHPLLLFRSDRSGAGRFFFYNDLRSTAVRALNYEVSEHLREKELLAEVLRVFPLNAWRQETPGNELFHDRIDALTEVFKGRTAALSRILTFVQRPKGFLMLWGPPGVGKSALVARATQILAWPDDLRRQAYPEHAPLTLEVHCLPFFIRRGHGTDQAPVLLDNLNQRLEWQWPTGLDLGSGIPEKKARLKAQLLSVSSRLQAHERLLLLVDGLDEGTGAERLLESLPLELPPGIIAIYASRRVPEVESQVWGAMDRENRESLDLSGLEPADVRALLYDHVDKYRLESSYVEEVARQSEGNPLYLRLLCDGLDEGSYSLNDIGHLPRSMAEFYQEVLRRLGALRGGVELLQLLAAARAPITQESVELILGWEPGSAGKALAGCGEVLQKGGSVEVESWQLFHESLRDLLRTKYPEGLAAMTHALKDWCLTWNKLGPAAQTYAVRFVIPHLLDVRTLAKEREESATVEELERMACDLLDDETFRERTFLRCGNALPLQEAIRAMQRILVPNSNRELPRLVRWAMDYHGEGHRLYQRQLAQLDRLGREAEGTGLESLADLAAMGPTARDRVLLVLRALHARAGQRRIPSRLEATVQGWLEEAGDMDLRALWALAITR